MNPRLAPLAFATACLICWQQSTMGLAQETAASKADSAEKPTEKPYTTQFSVTAIESGPFSISAIVEPAEMQKARLEPATHPEEQPVPAVQKQLEDFSRRLTEQLADQQKKLIEELTQQQKMLAEQLTRESEAAIKKITEEQAAESKRVIAAQQAQSNKVIAAQQAQANRVIAAQQAQSQRMLDNANRLAREQSAQNAALQQRIARLQNRQDYLSGAFMQLRQDQLLNNLDRMMLTDPLLARTLNPYGRRDLLGSIGDLLAAMSMSAQATNGFRNQQQSLDTLAARVSSMLSEKLSQEAARKVLTALNSGMSQPAAGIGTDELRRFASLIDKLDTMLKAQTPDFSPDDYERLALLAESSTDNESRAQLLEMSMESCGRIASGASRSPLEKQRARAYALLLRSQFEKLRDSAGSAMLAQIDFDIDKCTRIGNGRDMYA